MLNLYSLWIIPSHDTKKRLKKVIIDLSKKYDGPVFEPHMTLLGNINSEELECIKKTKVLASQIKPFTVSFSEISFSTTYFQSVFLRIKSSAELMEANLKAKKTYNFKNDVFMPHISLVYADVDMKTRERISNQIKFPNLEFLALELAIVKADSLDPKTWDIVEQIQFGSR